MSWKYLFKQKVWPLRKSRYWLAPIFTKLWAHLLQEQLTCWLTCRLLHAPSLKNVILKANYIHILTTNRYTKGNVMCCFCFFLILLIWSPGQSGLMTQSCPAELRGVCLTFDILDKSVSSASACECVCIYFCCSTLIAALCNTSLRWLVTYEVLVLWGQSLSRSSSFLCLLHLLLFPRLTPQLFRQVVKPLYL